MSTIKKFTVVGAIAASSLVGSAPGASASFADGGLPEVSKLHEIIKSEQKDFNSIDNKFGSVNGIEYVIPEDSTLYKVGEVQENNAHLTRHQFNILSGLASYMDKVPEWEAGALRGEAALKDVYNNINANSEIPQETVEFMEEVQGYVDVLRENIDTVRAADELLKNYTEYMNNIDTLQHHIDNDLQPKSTDKNASLEERTANKTASSDITELVNFQKELEDGPKRFDRTKLNILLEQAESGDFSKKVEQADKEPVTAYSVLGQLAEKIKSQVLGEPPTNPDTTIKEEKANKKTSFQAGEVNEHGHMRLTGDPDRDMHILQQNVERTTSKIYEDAGNRLEKLNESLKGLGNNIEEMTPNVDHDNSQEKHSQNQSPGGMEKYLMGLAGQPIGVIDYSKLSKVKVNDVFKQSNDKNNPNLEEGPSIA